MEAAPVYQAKRVRTTANLEQVGLRVARWGLILCLLFIGLAKFTAEEAHGIQPLVAGSPLMAWMYSVWSVQSRTNLIGTIELVLTLLLGIWSARASLLAGVGCAITFVLTVSLPFLHSGCVGIRSRAPSSGRNGTISDQGCCAVRGIG